MFKNTGLRKIFGAKNYEVI